MVEAFSARTGTVVLTVLGLLGGAGAAAAGPAEDESRALAALSRSFERIAVRVMPAVVHIEVIAYGPRMRAGGGYTAAAIEEEQIVVGSGVVVDPDGYIITNEHVVRGARRVRVMLRTGGRRDPDALAYAASPALDARVLGADYDTDLALLKVEATGLASVPLTPVRGVRQGQIVFALGSPEGFDHSMTMGIVSAVWRQPEPESPMVFIQTDADIRPGNSGGPLIDADGGLVGINTFVVSSDDGGDGPAFAVPTRVVRDVYRQLREHGTVTRRGIGIRAQTLTPLLAAGLGVPPAAGAVVSDVHRDGPAERAGLRVGDVILRVGDVRVEGLPWLSAALYAHDPSRPLDVLVARRGVERKFEVDVVPDDPADESLDAYLGRDRRLLPQVAAFALPVDADLASRLGLRSSEGLFIAALVGDLRAKVYGLQQGDVVISINGARVGSLADLGTRLDRLPRGAPVVFHVERRGRLVFVAAEVEA